MPNSWPSIDVLRFGGSREEGGGEEGEDGEEGDFHGWKLNKVQGGLNLGV